MRVHTIGNSHLAALKKAWDVQNKEKPDSFDVVFFGSHSGSLRQVGSRDGHFFTPDPDVRRSLSMTSGLDNPELKIGEFDVFQLHAIDQP